MFRKKKNLNFILNLLLSFGLVLLVTACSNPTQNSTFQADKTATISVYTALEDDQIKSYLSSFNKQHSEIKVNVVRDSTGIVTAKLLAEKDNPQADLVWGLAASSLLVADQKKLLEPYAPKGIENVNPQLRDDRNPPHWVGIDAWMSAFCVNTVELKKKNLPMPKSWADLTNPVYKGQIVMSNPASSGTGFLSVSAILQLKGEKEGWSYLDALDKNMAQYMHSGSKPCKAAGAGEFPIGISFDYRAVKQKNSGEPIEAVFPEEGSGWDIEANALVKKSEIKPAAKTFLDWAISPEISREYAKSFAITALKTDVPVPAGYPADPLKQLIKNDFKWAAANRDRIIETWSTRYGAKSEPKKT